MHELTVEQLTKLYPNGRESHVVFHDLDFHVNKNEFVSILGPSGCGKSTLLSIIAGFLQPTSGSVKVGQAVVTRPGPDRAFVFQSYNLFPWMTVQDNILYPMKQQGVSAEDRQVRLKHLLKLANLEGKEHIYPAQLSGGMKQRTGVVRALACHPKVLLMDEPLGAVDMQMRRRLQADVESILIQDPATVIMVTHDVDEAIFFSNRIILMSEHGYIIKDIFVDLERPRDRTSRAYKEMIVDVSDLLHSQNEF
ncbi:ABC transporter ATP-binding protein [Desulfonatronum sp. SC1]|uniref:ABC transporter ATP-binding protein n=1 Tax=Desulfonatronum sp. SC1 TaxID=2109626 RepID=UPI000D301088|nr:ABC transporter ATP-binding protein [Desulfonatronum sp. SC1]PTN32246.1 ABC transporter ATP-binding protein [Desulfonatronum sp. SC1]